MAITSLLDGDKLGAYKSGFSITAGSIAGPASYATGGFAADIETDLGISESSFVGLPIITSNAGYTGVFDATNNKIKSYTSGGTETTATTDLSSVTFYVHVVHTAG